MQPLLDNLGVSTYALTADPEEEARVASERNRLTYPLLYGLDGPAISKLLGTDYEEKRNILQPSAFILNPERAIVSVTHSSGPVGRLMAEETVRVIDFFQKRAAAKK